MNRRIFGTVVLAALAAPAFCRAQVELKFKHVEGRERELRQVVKTDQILTINGMDLTTKVEQVVMMRVRTGKREADGKLPVRVNFDAIQQDMDLPGGLKFTFDSKHPEDAKVSNPALDIIKDIDNAIVGGGYTILLDKDDHVTAIEGAEAVVSKAGEINPKAAEAIKKQFDPATLKRGTEQEYAVVEPGLVRPGDTWERTEVEEIGQGQTITYKRKYEYLGTVEKNDKQYDRIGVKALDAAYAMDPASDNPVKVANGDLKVESTEGEVLFDREGGYVYETRSRDRLKGKLALTINGMEFPADLDLTFDQSTTLAGEPRRVDEKK